MTSSKYLDGFQNDALVIFRDVHLLQFNKLLIFKNNNLYIVDPIQLIKSLNYLDQIVRIQQGKCENVNFFVDEFGNVFGHADLGQHTNDVQPFVHHVRVITTVW